MKRRALAAVLAVVQVSSVNVSGLFAQSVPAAEPYVKEEFPSWALDLRRAEAVAFGSLPFTVFFAQFAIDSRRYYENDWDRRYAPWPIKAAGAVNMTEGEYLTAFAAGCVGAVTVALVDYLIVVLKRRSVRRAADEKPAPVYRIERERAD
jgi:hypothetical protein